MKKKKIPRPLGTLIIYLGVIIFIGTAISFLIPPLVGQSQDFSEKVPQYAERTNQLFQGIETYAISHGVALDVEGFISGSFSSIFKSSEKLFSGMTADQRRRIAQKVKDLKREFPFIFKKQAE